MYQNKVSPKLKILARPNQYEVAQRLIERGAPDADEVRPGMTWTELTAWIAQARLAATLRKAVIPLEEERQKRTTFRQLAMADTPRLSLASHAIAGRRRRGPRRTALFSKARIVLEWQHQAEEAAEWSRITPSEGMTRGETHDLIVKVPSEPERKCWGDEEVWKGE
ncbi:hypothetical protein CALCODRAFT_552557 [Calocera cornea HHB12733]|uniref:Uncharacterized protein n=1 Tax=Calocera cornea HHB12733 TaxID=1353952 RepID=A0A165K097_9BASI|nr:hypothetical protein CALCODRAFT_552557 [Calocera cornea HHB12733]